jgi:hypothetical protein
MISFRFHLVSLVAVFLALGLGVLTGTTVLNRGIVTQLERRTDQLAEASSRLREQVRDLQTEVEGWNRFGEPVSAFVTEGRLSGREVVLVTQEGTDTQAIDRVRRGLEGAGAELLAVLSVDGRMALEEESDVSELGGILGTAETDPEDLAREAAAVLAQRLLAGPRGPDVLELLLGSGLVVNRGPGLGVSALRDVGRPGQAVVVVAGGAGEPVLEPDRFLVPFVTDLAENGGMVGAGEGMESEYSFVGPLRSDPTVSRLIVTQDNVDRLPGEVGLVLALEGLVEDRRPGHYGVKDGADGAIPPLS